jgi:hypothetical protein
MSFDMLLQNGVMVSQAHFPVVHNVVVDNVLFFSVFFNDNPTISLHQRRPLFIYQPFHFEGLVFTNNSRTLDTDRYFAFPLLPRFSHAVKASKGLFLDLSLNWPSLKSSLLSLDTHSTAFCEDCHFFIYACARFHPCFS